jgi:hypothetical protein
MAAMNLHPAIRARLEAQADHAKLGSCSKCGAQILTARVGRTAAVDVVVDTAPLDLAGELAARLDGLLTWRLITGPLGTRRLADRNVLTVPHDRAGTVLADHRCPPSPIQEALI